MDKCNTWGGIGSKFDEDAELLLDLLYGASEAEGYTVKYYRQINVYTTNYGGMQVTRGGKTFDISVKETEK